MIKKKGIYTPLLFIVDLHADRQLAAIYTSSNKAL